ncbi:hypothetical protein RJ640_027825 [Escallonia rubra]|uniref:AMP-dependent synthetase/ligase domain-containing protein n=1 Tax=Escallonia rubra TaxID=112253 RepID=A0AA88UNT3_9ASTE|nr:hypothetical protein RJ640_027825 [Escallonia rubra]
MPVSTRKCRHMLRNSYQVTNMSGAPTVLNMIVNSSVSDRQPLPHTVEIMTGGSPPPPQILLKMEELGFGVSDHLYGLTYMEYPPQILIRTDDLDALPLKGFLYTATF